MYVLPTPAAVATSRRPCPTTPTLPASGLARLPHPAARNKRTARPHQGWRGSRRLCPAHRGTVDIDLQTVELLRWSGLYRGTQPRPSSSSTLTGSSSAMKKAPGGWPELFSRTFRQQVARFRVLDSSTGRSRRSTSYATPTRSGYSSRCPPQGYSGPPRPRDHRDHGGHLLPGHALHGPGSSRSARNDAPPPTTGELLCISGERTGPWPRDTQGQGLPVWCARGELNPHALSGTRT